MTAPTRTGVPAPFRVRFDEAGPDGRLRTSVLLRYAQDLAWFHSASRGLRPRLVRASAGLTWLVRAAEVAVLGAVRVGDELDRRRRGSSAGAGSGRGAGPSSSTATGALVAWVHIDWVLLDARGAPDPHPARVRRGLRGARGDVPARARDALATRRPTPPRAASASGPQELDPMDHANNAVYADWLDERVIARRRPRWPGRDPGPAALGCASNTRARPSATPRSRRRPGATEAAGRA